MFRRVFRVPIYRLAGVIPLYEYRDPFDETERTPLKSPETPWERVMFLFQYTQDGYASKEYVSTVQLTITTFIAGIFVGSFKGSVQAYDKFLMANSATKFVSAYEARRKLQDTCMLEGLRSGLTFGAKCGAFVAITGMGIIIISAYRGKDGILEYVLSTALAGAVARCYLGFVGAAVGSFVGALLGSVIGTIIWGIGKLSGVTIKDTQEMLYGVKVARDKAQHEINKDMQESGYTSSELRQWLKNLKNKFEYTIDDRDVKYVAQPMLTDGTDEPSRENTTSSLAHDQISDDDTKRMTEKEIPQEEKPDR